MPISHHRRVLPLLLVVTCSLFIASAQTTKKHFKVVAFFTAQHDLAHISFVKEANTWFFKLAKQKRFTYDSTSNWRHLNATFLSSYDVVIFLDSRPEDITQRVAFEEYMKKGGSWLGFHFSAFALTPSAYPQDWPWYHNELLGSGQYSNNTWRPTSAILRVEDRNHPVTRNLPHRFKAAPNEWYNWEKKLADNKYIDVLLAIDSTSFPLGTGPKPHEIWHNGYYPVAWTNRHYNMVYMNMGHNDMDYENKTNKTLSSTFSSIQQNRFIENSLFWLANASGKLPNGN